MEPTGQAFIDYALPDWASGAGMSTMALGEESGSGFLADDFIGDPPPEADWGGSENQLLDDIDTITTRAFGEETGGSSYPNYDYSDWDEIYLLDPTPIPLPDDIICKYPIFLPEATPETIDSTFPVKDDQNPAADQGNLPSIEPANPFDDGVFEANPDEVVTTLALGEESATPFPDLPTFDWSDPSQTEEVFVPIVPPDNTNPLDPIQPTDSIDPTVPKVLGYCPGGVVPPDNTNPLDPTQPTDSIDATVPKVDGDDPGGIVPPDNTNLLDPTQPTDSIDPTLPKVDGDGLGAIVPPDNTNLLDTTQPTDSIDATVPKVDGDGLGAIVPPDNTNLLDPTQPTDIIDAMVPKVDGDGLEGIVPPDNTNPLDPTQPTDSIDATVSKVDGDGLGGGGETDTNFAAESQHFETVMTITCVLATEVVTVECYAPPPAEVVILPTDGTQQPPAGGSGANLKITDVILPSDVTAGTGIEITWTYINDGEAFYSDPPTAIVTYSRNDIYGDEDDIYVNTFYGYGNSFYTFGLIPSQASVTNSQIIYLNSVTAGAGHLFFKIDPYNQVAETDEIDNVFMQAINVVLPDLAISNVAAPTQAVSGENVQVSWTVTNQSELPLTNSYYYTNIVFSTNEIFGDSDDIYVATGFYSYWTDIFQSQASAAFQLDIRLPGQAGGTGYLLFAVDPYNYLEESDETNNILSLPLLIRQPNLALTNISAPSKATSGDQIDVTWSIANQGDVPLDNPNYVDSVIFSKNDILGDDDDVYLLGGHNYYHGSLQPLDQEIIKSSITLPADFVGEGYLFVKLDSMNFISETDEADNTLSQQITIFERDLTLIGVSAPDSASAGTMLDLSITVRNDGELSADFLDQGSVIFSTNQILGDEDDVVAGYYSSNEYGYSPIWCCGIGFGSYPITQDKPMDLQPGETKTVSISFWLDFNISGTGYLMIETDQGEISTGPIDIAPYDYISWWNEFTVYELPVCELPVFKPPVYDITTFRSTTAMDFHVSAISSAAMTAVEPMGIVETRYTNETVDASIPTQLADEASSRSVSELLSTQIPQVSLSQSAIPPSHSETSSRRLPPGNALDLTVIPSTVAAAQDSSDTSADDATTGSTSSQTSGEQSSPTPAEQATDNSAVMPQSEGLLLSLLSDDGVTPNGIDQSVSQEHFWRDPLSGLKLGELATAS